MVHDSDCWRPSFCSSIFWGQSFQRWQEISDVNDWEWKQNENEISPRQMLNADASKACHQLVRCSCSSRGIALQDANANNIILNVLNSANVWDNARMSMNRDNKFISFRFLFLQFINITALDAWTEYRVSNSKNSGRDKISAYIYILCFVAY